MKKITGTIGAMGHSQALGGGVLYSSIRLDTEDGRSVSLDNVVVYSLVDSFLKPGVAGTFYYNKIRKLFQLVAADFGDKQIFDEGSLNKQHRSALWGCLGGWLLLIVGILGGNICL